MSDGGKGPQWGHTHRMVRRLLDSGVTDSTFVVGVALCLFMNRQGQCWPSIATIAERCNKSERTVSRAITQLVELGFLVREWRGRKTPVYRWVTDPAKLVVARDEARERDASQQRQLARADKALDELIETEPDPLVRQRMVEERDARRRNPGWRGV